MAKCNIQIAGAAIFEGKMCQNIQLLNIVVLQRCPRQQFIFSKNHIIIFYMFLVKMKWGALYDKALAYEWKGI